VILFNEVHLSVDQNQGIHQRCKLSDGTAAAPEHSKKKLKNPRSTHFYKNKNIILPPSASTLTPKKWARGRGIAGVDYLQSTR
jgi:hypothetical protein